MDDLKSLYTRLRLQSLNQNARDLASYKEKLSMCIKKIEEAEGNLTDIKNVEVEDNKKYDLLGKPH